MVGAVDIIQSFQQLLIHLADLNNHILHDLADYPIWVAEDDVMSEDREKIITVFSNFQPAGETPQHTLACQGAVAGNFKTLELAEKLNQAKDTFKLLGKAYLTEQNSEDTALIRRILASSGYSMVKLKQVYRHIRTINFHPRRISFTRVLHNSHRVITKAAALEKLRKLGNAAHLQVQEQRLNSLKDNKIVVHRDVKPLWAANVATFKNEEGTSTTTRILTSLPLIYLHDKELPMPQVGFSQKYNKHQKSPRSDKKIEDEPFLPSISGYCYKKD